ncbi:uncharacterized protein LOC128219438 [Mya arenaria]|uniref:uncharacterized protein LOC128219438 n=1 Tax=Mya arenaria TaxID=6604 RepID=UPI0022E6296C|nr:uncharacterized protein LOC128219438 [Mya arenaria]
MSTASASAHAHINTSMETASNSSINTTPVNTRSAQFTPQQHQQQYIYSPTPVYMQSPVQLGSQMSLQGPPHPGNPHQISILADHDIQRIVDSLKISLKDEINAIVNVAIQTQVQPLKDELTHLRAKVIHLEGEMDAANQYSRRNCILISNMKELPEENTNDIAIQVAKEGGLDITPSDIDRSHRNGKPKVNKPRDIIVKFVSYKTKHDFMKIRKQLRQRKSQAYINEHLTSFRGELAFQCRLLKKNPKSPVLDTWTYDGNIYIKTEVKGHMIRVNTHNDLVQFGYNPNQSMN